MEPWQLGVAQSAKLMKTLELSPVELTESLLSRVAAVDDGLQAWVTVDGEGSRRAAGVIADRLARGEACGPLAGVPIGIKDVIHVAGLPTTASSKVLADYVATEDAACVARLRRADAGILGKLHTAEFACADPPPTRNAWNVEHTPGGSSSGSGVSVAVGAVPAALGTQTGGSVLRPAAYNGVVGVKATYGMVSNRGVIPVAWSLDHVGVIARSVADATIVLSAMAGHDPSDPSSAPEAAAFVPPTSEADRPPVIGLIRSFFLDRCEPEMAAHTREVAAELEAEGAQIREIDLAPSFQRIAGANGPIMRGEMYAYHRDQFARSKDLYGPKNAALLEEGSRVTLADYLAAIRARPGLVADLEASIAGVDVALTPATPAPAPRNTTTTGDASFQSPWSYAGLPTVALPSGVNAWGMPLGVQLIGHRWGDSALLQCASWCEAVIGFAAHPPSWVEA